MLRAAGNADNTVASRLQQLCNALRAIDPTGDWAWIHRASARLYAKAVLVRDPVNRMQPAEDVIQLGLDLMHAAEHDRFRTPCDRATMFRDGLMIAFLIQRPFRSANLTGIALGRHLEQRGGQWRLFFEGDETKGGETIECSWPPSLVDALERYLEVHRKELLKGGAARRRSTDALWISRQGKAMGASAASYQICARTKETFGKPINPHTFRHIAATTIATSNPEGVADIQGVLGHSSMSASEKHYNRAKMIGAGAKLNATIAGLRKQNWPSRV
jgi:integrase